MNNSIDSQRTFNQSTDKALALVEYLASQSEPVRLQDISKAMDMNISTTLRFINTLVKNGYVIQDKNTQKYGLTMKICTIAHNVVRNNGIVTIASPYLRKLADMLGECVCLSIEQAQSVIYVDTYESRDQMLKSLAFIGKIAPMHCTGTGKLFLSDYSEERLKAYVDTKGLKLNTIHTITVYEQFKDELERIRTRGYSIDNEECELGARCIAVPIRNYTGQIIAGISVTGPATRMTFDMIYKNLDVIMEVGREVSAISGYLPQTSPKSS